MAPGSGAYCTSQCDSYCEEVGGDYQGDVVRGEATPGAGAQAASAQAASGKCDAYKTEAAKKYCGEQAASAAKAARAADDASPLAMNNGIFGDSGVTYSKGLEELFGVVFGANRQNQDVSKANVEEFGGDIAAAAKKAFVGQPAAPRAQRLPTHGACLHTAQPTRRTHAESPWVPGGCPRGGQAEVSQEYCRGQRPRLAHGAMAMAGVRHS